MLRSLNDMLRGCCGVNRRHGLVRGAFAGMAAATMSARGARVFRRAAMAAWRRDARGFGDIAAVPRNDRRPAQMVPASKLFHRDIEPIGDGDECGAFASDVSS